MTWGEPGAENAAFSREKADHGWRFLLRAIDRWKVMMNDERDGWRPEIVVPVLLGMN